LAVLRFMTGSELRELLHGEVGGLGAGENLGAVDANVATFFSFSRR
jgi:hypothetical protein